MPLFLAVAAGTFAYFSHETFPVSDFYGIAAQIIPILMIAFALEARATNFLSNPQVKFYSVQLFVFLLGGEIFALLGASGALREPWHPHKFAEGFVAQGHWTNIIAAGTAAGLVGGFAMLLALALSGSGWLFLSFSQEPDDQLNEPEKPRRQAQEAVPPEE